MLGRRLFARFVCANWIHALGLERTDVVDFVLAVAGVAGLDLMVPCQECRGCVVLQLPLWLPVALPVFSRSYTQLVHDSCAWVPPSAVPLEQW
jgi:hypothetical protein